MTALLRIIHPALALRRRSSLVTARHDLFSRIADLSKHTSSSKTLVLAAGDVASLVHFVLVGLETVAAHLLANSGVVWLC